MPEIDITEYVVSVNVIVQRPERNKWVYGIVSAGEVRLTLRDNGMFGPQTSASSLFSYYGRDRARLRIMYPSVRGGAADVVVWDGWTTSKDTSTSPSAGTTTLLARTLDAVLIDEVISAGNIVNGLTLPQIVARVFNEASVAQSLPGALLLSLVDPVQGGLALANGAELLGDERRANETLQKLLSVTDGLLSYDFNAARPLVFTRGDLDTTAYPAQMLDNILDIKREEDGGEGVRNQFVIETGLEGADAKVVVENEPSIHTYGLRSAELDCKWINDSEACIQIGEYLVARLAHPRAAVQVMVSAWEISPLKTIVGQRLEVAVPPSAAAGAVGYGSGNHAGVRYARTRHERIQGAYWIEEVSRDVRADTATLLLRQRVAV